MDANSGHGVGRGDEVAEMRDAMERLAKEAGAAEAMLERKNRELCTAAETLRRLEEELAELEAVHRAVLTSADIKDRDLVYAVDALRKRDTRLKEQDELLVEPEATFKAQQARIRTLEDRLRTAVEDGEGQRQRISALESILEATRIAVDQLLASRRWRFGHATLSIPHSLLGRKRPGTVADRLRELRQQPPAPPPTEAG